MGNTLSSIKGGSYLVQQTAPEDVFFPEDFTDEHLLIKKTAEQFVTKEVGAKRDEIEAQQFEVVADLMRKAGELGLLAHSIPESFGGLGLDKVTKAIVGEQVGRTGSYGVAHSNHTCIATLPITYYGTQEQKGKYLPKLASGEYLGAYCLTEPDAGSDAMGGKTTAQLNESGTHYLLNGTKIYITNAAFSDTFIVYAKVDGKQFTAFIVEKDFPGLSLGPEEKKMGIKGSSTRSVILEDCVVPIENVLGEIGRGHIIAFTVLNLGRFNLGAACMGGAKEALKLTLTHINNRKQFGKTLGEFGLTKEKVAKMEARIFAAEALQYRTAFLLEEVLKGLDGSDNPKLIVAGLSELALECAACKVYGSETLDFIADEALQLHGGAGFISEYPIEQIYRDSRINRIFEGTNEINRLLLTGQFLKKSLKGELPYEQAVKKAFQHVMVKDAAEQSPIETIKDIRAIYLVLVEYARKKYGMGLEEEQEVLTKLSDIAILLFAAESAVLRSEKSASTRHQLLMETVLQETVGEVLSNTRVLMEELIPTGDQMREQLYTLLLSKTFPDSVKRNRMIAERGACHHPIFVE
ncbi:alkylation response protein AidB-like acyl-CoA dehydrogenase [Salirhabdus euzebyi]|uniref:Alkylation response protein AidB-like acyl-CoA dehydrogenase n=1 Tax=Salirhabdus euzebyi TaxID=394506 RepID=A0A841Q4E0_9BACI|nr:acyl-CoA dehydrogenase family protein [Salirhabdus euzebyi]MBB6453264.1 alkylation response protein AidB-like acyl-CoA dehydrogenase [Salirhabdus euzebyi]